MPLEKEKCENLLLNLPIVLRFSILSFLPYPVLYSVQAVSKHSLSDVANFMRVKMNMILRQCDEVKGKNVNENFPTLQYFHPRDDLFITLRLLRSEAASIMESAGLKPNYTAGASYALETEEERDETEKEREEPTFSEIIWNKLREKFVSFFPHGKRGPMQTVTAVINLFTERVTEQTKRTRSSKFHSMSAADRSSTTRLLIQACSDPGSSKSLQDLIETIDIDFNYPDPDSVGDAGFPLSIAARISNVTAIAIISGGLREQKSGNPDGTDGGLADVNRKDDNGWSAAHFAVSANSPESLRALHDARANLSEENEAGYTPYAFAVRLKHKDAMEVLEELGHNTRHPEFDEAFSRLRKFSFSST